MTAPAQIRGGCVPGVSQRVDITQVVPSRILIGNAPLTRSLRVGFGMHSTLHVLIESTGRERVMNDWPGAGATWPTDPTVKVVVRDRWEALDVAARIKAEREIARRGADLDAIARGEA